MGETRYEFTGLTPALKYENANAMLEWLSRVLGFEELERYVDAEGIVRQAHVRIGAAELWLSGHGAGYFEKRGARPDQYTVVWVDDVDAHHARVRAAGVDARPPEDMSWGARSYYLLDPEGYGWSFARRLPQGYVQTKPLEEGGLREISTGARNAS